MLCMPHVASEAELMLNDLSPYLRRKHGDEVLLLLTEDAKNDAKDDQWDEENKRVTCVTDRHMEEEEEDDLGFK